MPGFGPPVYAGYGKTLTYEMCMSWWENRKGAQKKHIRLGTSTWLRLQPGAPDYFCLRLHHTDILRIFEGNVYGYATGGWYTMTTKSRLNEFGPLGLFSDQGVWTVSRKDNSKEYGWTDLGMFQEHMIVGPRGGIRRPKPLPPVGKGIAIVKRARKLKGLYLKVIPKITPDITRSIYHAAKNYPPDEIYYAICQTSPSPYHLAAAIRRRVQQQRGGEGSWNQLQKHLSYRNMNWVAEDAVKWFCKYYISFWAEFVVRKDMTLPRRYVNLEPRRLAYTKLFDLDDNEMI